MITVTLNIAQDTKPAAAESQPGKLAAAEVERHNAVVRADRAETERDIARMRAEDNKRKSDVWEASARYQEPRAEAAEKRERDLRAAIEHAVCRLGNVSHPIAVGVWEELRAALTKEGK